MPLTDDEAIDAVLTPRSPAAPASAPAPAPAVTARAPSADDLAVEAVFDNQSQRASQNLAAASRFTPEQAAKVHTLARDAGLPAYAVEGNEAAVFADLTARKNRDLMLKNPVLARAVANNSAFADIAFDDMQNAADVADAWEKSGFAGASRAARKVEDRRAEAFRGLPSGTVGAQPRSGFISEMGDAAMRGLSGLKAKKTIIASELGLYRGAEAERDAQLRQELREYGSRPMPEEVAAGLAEIKTAGDESFTAALGAIVRNPRAVLEVTAESFTGSAPSLALSAAGAMAGPLGRAAGAYLGSGLVEYSSVLLDTLEGAGSAADIRAVLSDEKKMAAAREEGVKRGLTVGLFDAITAGLAGKLLAGAKATVPSVAGRAAGELALQAVGGGAGEAAAGAWTGKFNWGDVLLEAFAEIPSAITEIPGNYSYYKSLQEKAGADADAANLSSLMDLVGKSAAKARDPVTYGEFMSGVTADTPLYVDANELQNVLAQNKIDPATIPTLAEQLAQPSVTGDVEIPAGALMTAFAGTPAQEQIVQHVRKDQSNLSAAQFADLPAQEAAMVRLAQDVAEKQKKNKVFTTEAREIEDDYLKQLRSTPPAPGRATMSERDNRFEARVMSAFYTVAADLWGATPKQIRDGWTSASGQKYSGWKPTILGATDQAQPASTLSQGFDHGNAMLNVGLDVGATDRAQKIDADFVKAEIEKLGVQVLSGENVDGEYELNGQMVKELTYVPHLSRPLTEAEVNALAIATGQEAIGQYDNGVGNLWGPNAAAWGAFNPEFFKDQAGTKLSDAQKELAQKKTKTPKITEIVKGQKLEQSTPLTAKQWADVRGIALETLSEDEKTAWLEAEQEVLAGVEEANRNSDVLKEIAKTALDKMPVPRVSTVPLLAGRLKLKIEPTGNFRKDGTRKTRVPDVARALFNKFRNAKASVETPEGREIMARAMTHEALYALSQDGHAVGWYDRKVREAIMTFALVHPEVLTSPRHNLAFRLIAAITSNGQAVRDNFILANDIYNLWSKEQVFPTEFAFDESQTEEEVDEEETPPAEGFEGGGPRKPAMVAAFKKINVLVKELGWDAIESEMLQLRTVRDVEKEFGLKIGGENKDTVIPTAVGLGGPKIGNFFANLSGYFDSPTMDLWFMRTAGRMEGTLLETKPALVEHLDELLTLLPEEGEVKGQPVATLRKEIEKYKALDKEAQLDAETTLKTLKHVSIYARAQFSQFASPHPDTGKTYWDKSDVNVNSRRLVNNLAAVREAPSSGGERNNLRAVVTRAMELLEKQGISLTAADLQAVLWYHEKNLYSKLGDISASAKPWDYASAARFSVGRELGLVDVGSRQRAEAVPAGQPAAGGAGGLGAVQGLGQEDQGGALAQAVRSAGAVAGPVVGIHYSKAPRTSLASSMFGTGMKAAEAERVAASNDPRIKQRIAFYVDTGKGITPESDVGSYPHVATLRNLYDADADALKIWRNSKGDMNAAESAVLDAGFDGYLTRNFGSTGAVVMLGQRSLEVEGITKADVATRAEQPPSPEIPKMKQAALAIMQNRALPNGQQSVESWKRDLERSDPDTAALISWDKIPAGDYYKDQIAGQLWQTKWFYSALQRAIEGAPTKVFSTGKAIAQWLSANAGKLAVKKEELEATGITDWLETQGKVTKEQVVEFLQQGGVKIEEVQLGGKPPITTVAQAKAYLQQRFNEDPNERYGFDNPADYVQIANDWLAGETEPNETTKFHQYQLPGGENYREVLITLPSARGMVDDETARRLGATAGWQTDAFRSSHFPDQPNIIAHVRFNERTDASGKRVLFIEEIQSDWAQKGRKEGFGGFEVVEPSGQLFGRYSSLTDAEAALNRAKAGATMTRISDMGVPSAPFVTDTKSWTALALKRMIAYAVENGFDSVAWTTGEQQAARYDLSKQVERVTIQKMSRDSYALQAIGLSGETIVDRTISKPEDAEEYIGKEPTAKLIKDMGAGIRGQVSGLDLKVGGEGMKGFYDQIVPQVANDVLKKLGGGKVGTVTTLTTELDKRAFAFKRESNGMWTVAKAEREVLPGEGRFWTGSEWAQSDDDSRMFNTRTEAENSLGGQQPGFDITPAMREAVGQGLPLFAEAAGPRRGSFNPLTLDLRLLADANRSTFIHEASHFFMAAYIDMASQPDAPPQLKEFVENLLGYLFEKLEGPVSTTGTNLERWNAMTLDQQRAYWEFFAEGFEQYAMTGKAPTKALQSAFNAFAKWMKEIYKTLKNFVTMHGTKPLDAELTQYFDRMLATDEELEAARAERGFQTLFKNLAESGMSPAQFADYMALDDLQKTEAEELLRSRSIRDMKWLSNAKSKAIKELQAEADELRALVQASVEEELANTPIRQAERWLKKGEMKVGGDEIKAQAGHRLNMEIVKAMFPEGAIAGKIDFAKLGRGKNALASSTGTQHPDDVAQLANEQFGGQFRNGEDLVRQLIDMPAFKDEVTYLTDLRMLEEHGDLATPEAIAKAADEAILNDAHLRMVATEVWALGNRTGSVAALTKAAKAFAQNLVDNTVVKKLSPSSFANAAIRAGKAATRAYAQLQSAETASKGAYTREYNAQIKAGAFEADAKDAAQTKADEARAKAEAKIAERGDRSPTDIAATEKRTEMVNAAAAKAAYAAEAEVRAIVTRLRKISAYSDKHSSVTTREMGVVQAVRAILAEFDIGQHGEKATKYLKTLNEYDPTLGAVLDSTIESLAPEAKPWQNLKVAELRELHAAVTGLWRVAKDVRSVELAGEKMSLDDARAQLIAKLEERSKAGRDSKAFSLTDAEIRNQDFQSYTAKAVRPESWISMQDGLDEYGPWRRLIWNSIDRAQLDYNAEKAEKLKALKALLVPVMADMTDVQIDAPELGGTFGAGSVIGYSELLHAILHTGNLSNKTKLLVGRGWGSLREDGSLDSSKWDSFLKRMYAEGKITKTHMDFVQGVWDLLESMKEGAQKAHRATTGRYFEEIEPSEIVTPFGVYRGGYAPAIVDRRQVADMDLRKLQEAAEMDVVHSFEKPAGGFTKSRAQNYNQKLELNIAALGRHIDQVLLFSHMSVPVRNVQRVLKGKDLSSALAEQDRAALGNILGPWLHSASTQTVTEKGKLSYENMPMFTKMRSRAGAALMFANVSNSVQQLTGFFPAALKVSKKELLFAAAKGWYKPRELAASVAEMSPYMKQRIDNEVHAMAEEIDQILLNPTKFERAQDWAIAHSYFLQTAVDSAMSPIIWQAKFNEATARGAAKQEAIDLADSAVRMTQGSNRAIDIAAMEKGSPFYRMFMQFAGYFNTQVNLVGEKLARERLMADAPAKYGRIGMVLTLGWLAPAIASALVVQLFRGGVDDDDKDGEWLDDWLISTFLAAPAKYVTAAIPVFGQAINAALNAFNDKPYDDRISMSPAVSIVEAGVRGGKAAIGALEDPTKAGRAIRDVGSLVSLFTGVPITPATKAIGYATDVETGKVAPTGPVDYGRGIITGTASPESKR